MSSHNYNYNDVNYIETARPPEYSSLMTTVNTELLPPSYLDAVQQQAPPGYTVSPLDTGLQTPPGYTELDTGGQETQQTNNEAVLLITTPTHHTDLLYWQSTTATTTTAATTTITTVTRRQQLQRYLIIALLCTTLLCNPFFGLVAVCIARFDVNRRKPRGFPYNQQSTDGCPYNHRIAVIVSVIGITITVITVVILCSVNVLLTSVVSGPRTCSSTELLTHNNITYRYCVPVTSQSTCGFGFYSSVVNQCYYDSRYESSRERYSGHRTCVSPMADLATDGYCYYSSLHNCQYSTNYINNTCYTFGFHVSASNRCQHGIHMSQTSFCYYKTMYRSRDNKCRDVTADLFTGGYCFSNEH